MSLCLEAVNYDLNSGLNKQVPCFAVQVTGAKNCKHQSEMQHLAETYLCLLESTARQSELAAVYRRGERSIQESAAMVGLRLPEEKP